MTREHVVQTQGHPPNCPSSTMLFHGSTSYTHYHVTKPSNARQHLNRLETAQLRCGALSVSHKPPPSKHRWQTAAAEYLQGQEPLRSSGLDMWLQSEVALVKQLRASSRQVPNRVRSYLNEWPPGLAGEGDKGRI